MGKKLNICVKIVSEISAIIFSCFFSQDKCLKDKCCLDKQQFESFVGVSKVNC